MASLPDLTDEFIADSYKGILHTANQPVTGSELKQVYDGLGNSTGLKVSSNTVGVGNYVFPSSGTLGQTFVFDAAGNVNAGSLYPVGAVYFTIAETNPGTFLGGTWSRIAEGRFIAGVGVGNDGSSTRTLSAGNNNGEYLHALSVAELPEHSHTVRSGTGGQNTDALSVTNGFAGMDAIGTTASFNNIVSTTGSNTPHENTPPGFGLYVWARIA